MPTETDYTTANIDRAIEQILDLWWMVDDTQNGVVVNRRDKKTVMRQIILAHLGLGGVVSKEATA